MIRGAASSLYGAAAGGVISLYTEDGPARPFIEAGLSVGEFDYQKYQLKAGGHCIFGVMVESHLHAGAQKFSPGKDDPAKLAYGQSITDACIGWEPSLQVLETLHDAVKARRR